ncbi:unnamed protein product [Polarella glacialis]|uniref:Uncharacterized protein n=1 Tax=Polarella glacialis TaxID=89957 RepID=A0A813H8I4_POLGL|nr:unnamed protein product [Polarella glacialis]
MSLTVIFAETAQQQQLSILGGAFAAIKDDGSFILWCDADSGGDSSWVADKLQEGVDQVVGHVGAFAAIKDDGSVVSWGQAASGGDSSLVADKLQEGVGQVVGICCAFAAIKRRWICSFVGSGSFRW